MKRNHQHAWRDRPNDSIHGRRCLGGTPLRGFTLIEVLVVIAIITILARILVHTLFIARQQSKNVIEVNNMRQLAIAFELFSTDNDGRLPGGWDDRADTNADHRNWLCNSVVGSSCNPATTPTDGTIFRYVNKNKNIYRCPLLPKVVLGDGVNSNGFSDYAILKAFVGAKVEKVPGEARYQCPDGKFYSVLTPMIVQEDAAFSINSGANPREGSHSGVNRMSTIHKGGAFYATMDGSVRRLIFAKGCSTIDMNDWSAMGPESGNYVTLAATGSPPGNTWTWGTWNTR